MARFPRIAFFDLEASGFGSNSYPTELGWAVVQEDGSVLGDSMLIRPPARWTTYANAWSAPSEALTGISRQMLDRDGLSPAEVMKRFLVAVEGCELFADEPDFDHHWLGMLAEAALVDLWAKNRKREDAHRGGWRKGCVGGRA